MFLWAKHLVFPVHQAVSNLRVGTRSHSFLCPDGPAYGAESVCEMTALLLPLTSFHPTEISQIQLLKKYCLYQIICLINFS